MGYWECSVEGICPIMLLRCVCGALRLKFCIKAVQIPECLPAPGPLSVNGAEGKVYSAWS